MAIKIQSLQNMNLAYIRLDIKYAGEVWYGCTDD